MKPVGILYTYNPGEYCGSITTLRIFEAVQLFDSECCIYLYDENTFSYPKNKLTKWIQMSW